MVPHPLSLESGFTLSPRSLGFGARVHAGDVNAQAVLCSPADGEAQGPAVPSTRFTCGEEETALLRRAWRAPGTLGTGAGA